MAEAAPTKRGTTRTKARKRALDILFEADLRELPAAQILADHTEWADPAVRPFSAELVTGVTNSVSALDAALAKHLPDGWSVERMPRVDRNLARLAAFEILHTDTDPAIVLAECLTLATELSTDESPAFLNGVLGALVRTTRPESE
ncbi:NusB antitermination factor [Propionicimonas paludicola]|uniref:Transcription antitermination protein NusB n=1 Tax=Propionicimonas paludicola TaxID=185243 RepID=A0A2A9CSV4_9ACTN|nr:transcription antitermination factor NusB [Propionicimonas paludicola]PFG16720.1 NusB antitermination factor [Propionicimonas paludicola]